MADPETTNKAKSSSPSFLISSRIQEHALKNVFRAISHTNITNITTPASMIATKFHFYLRFHQSEPSYSRGKKSDKGEHQKTKERTR